MTKIAIIGAGISALAIARQLAPFAKITIFEKARGVGGRMSTRYADPFYFDHGAQCFTARTKSFQQFITPMIEKGEVKEWKGKVINFEEGKKISKRLWFEKHFVACPNMNSMCKKLSEGLDIVLNAEISPIADRNHLISKDNRDFGFFDWIISTAPPAQTSALFSSYLPTNSVINQSSMKGCYALMIGLNRPWDKQWIAAKVRNNFVLKWISINSTKPDRSRDITAITVHSRSSWANENMDMDINEAQEIMLEEFKRITSINCDGAFLSTHRWKYALVDSSHKRGYYIDPDCKLAAVSDWCTTSRIEEAWLSAMDLCDGIRSC